MATHLAAWVDSIDSATLTRIRNLVDDVLNRPSVDRYRVPTAYNYIHWAAALGPNITRAQIVTPTLGVQRQSLEIVPRARGALIFTRSMPEIFKPFRPIALTPDEDLEVQAAEDGAGATSVAALVALGPATLPPPPDGPIRRIRATASVTLTPNTWTTVTLVPDLSLEPGIYTLIHFIPNSAGCIAARALFVGQVFRPGMPGLPGAEPIGADYDDGLFRQLGYYAMGTFKHTDFPQFQFLSATADTSETVIMDVVKTG
jgi:hypothetical protein